MNNTDKPKQIDTTDTQKWLVCATFITQNCPFRFTSMDEFGCYHEKYRSSAGVRKIVLCSIDNCPIRICENNVKIIEE